jgi:hypothetical protein
LHWVYLAKLHIQTNFQGLEFYIWHWNPWYTIIQFTKLRISIWHIQLETWNFGHVIRYNSPTIVLNFNEFKKANFEFHSPLEHPLTLICGTGTAGGFHRWIFSPIKSFQKKAIWRLDGIFWALQCHMMSCQLMSRFDTSLIKKLKFFGEQGEC